MSQDQGFCESGSGVLWFGSPHSYYLCRHTLLGQFVHFYNMQLYAHILNLKKESIFSN